LDKFIYALSVALKLLCLAAAFVFILVAIIYWPEKSFGYVGTNTSAQFNTVDFVTIILAAVAVILTALAIILAVAGVIGYTQIKEEALKTANSAAERAAADKVNEILPRQVMLALKQQRLLPSENDSNEIAKSQSESTE
jgi:hypothetical protein